MVEKEEETMALNIKPLADRVIVAPMEKETMKGGLHQRQR